MNKLLLFAALMFLRSILFAGDPKMISGSSYDAASGDAHLYVTQNCGNIMDLDGYLENATDFCKKQNGFLRKNSFDGAYRFNRCEVDFHFQCYHPEEESKAEAAKKTSGIKAKQKEDALRKEKINLSKRQCEELGYPKESDKFKSCVMELIR